MIKNNRFSGDDDSDRAERLELLSANIDTYAVELGYGGARLAWPQGADAGVEPEDDCELSFTVSKVTE